MVDVINMNSLHSKNLQSNAFHCLTVLRNQAEVTDLGKDQEITHVLNNFTLCSFIFFNL